MKDTMILLGRIGGAHGLKGEVKIASFTANAEDIASYGLLANEDKSRIFEIASFRSGGGGTVIARLKDVSDRGAAEALRGTDLYVPREALPSPADKYEYYQSDLIGLRAISEDGGHVGEVIAIHNFGAGDLLEVRLTDGGRTELIPFESAHVPEVDIKAGRVNIIWPVYQTDEDASPP